MAFELTEAYVDLNLHTQTFDSALKGVNKKLQRLGRGMLRVGKYVGVAATALAGAGVYAGKQMVMMAADAEEARNRFRQVFGDMSDATEQWSQQLASAVGRNKTEIQDGLSSFMGFAQGLGFGQKQANEMARSLQELSIDFASFNNMSDAEAQQRFISAMSGSAEVLSMYGVNVRAAAIEQELLEMGIEKSAAKATEQEKAIARLNIIMKTMTRQGAVGDAVRTADSLTNQMKRAGANIRTLSENIGFMLMPQVNEFVTKFNEWLTQNEAKVMKWGELVVDSVGNSLQFIGDKLSWLTDETVLFLDIMSAAWVEFGSVIRLVTSQIKIQATEMRKGLNAKAESAMGWFAGKITEGAIASLGLGLADQTNKAAADARKFIEDYWNQSSDDFNKEMDKNIRQYEKEADDAASKIAEILAKMQQDGQRGAGGGATGGPQRPSFEGGSGQIDLTSGKTYSEFEASNELTNELKNTRNALQGSTIGFQGLEEAWEQLAMGANQEPMVREQKQTNKLLKKNTKAIMDWAERMSKGDISTLVVTR